MKSLLSLLFILCSLSFVLGNGVELKNIGDDVLLQLIKSEDYLVVLFQKPNCDVCEKYAAELLSIQSELEKDLKASIVTTTNSHLVRLYNPAKEPSLVFFRHSLPLLYDGSVDASEIYHFFKRNLQPAVKELSDEIFEHITQAATGSTTGDWLIMFYSSSCIDCQRLLAVWEGVAGTLKGHINVARIDSGGNGHKTAKRFNIKNTPAFIFLRLGKLYRYDLPKHDIKTFVSFAQDWYKNVRAETVPLLESPFDQILDWCVETLKLMFGISLDLLSKYSWLWQIGLFGFSLVLITAIIALWKAERKPKAESKKKEK